LISAKTDEWRRAGVVVTLRYSLSGHLRLCAPVTFARLHVIPRLWKFLAEHPKLEVEVVMDDRNVDLVAAGVDLALRLGTLSDSTLTARRIAQTRR
jgi:DNA-binding transcriptional LysR family regulator